MREVMQEMEPAILEKWHKERIKEEKRRTAVREKGEEEGDGGRGPHTSREGQAGSCGGGGLQAKPGPSGKMRFRWILCMHDPVTTRRLFLFLCNINFRLNSLEKDEEEEGIERCYVGEDKRDGINSGKWDLCSVHGRGLLVSYTVSDFYPGWTMGARTEKRCLQGEKR